MKRRVPQPSKIKSQENGPEDNEIEVEYGEEAKEVEEEVMEQYPTEATALLARVDKHLLFRQYMEPHAAKPGFLDLFLFSMLRRGDLKIKDISLSYCHS